jgi:signal transduction histidine kinase
LYIASEIAKAHGGALTVTSTVDNGTVFTFSFGAAAAIAAR